MMDYETLLAAAKQDPATVDFTQLRLAFSRSSRYDPSDVQVLDEDDGLDAALSAGDWREARQLAESALARNYVRLHPHICAALACCQLKDVPEPGTTRPSSKACSNPSCTRVTGGRRRRRCG